MKISSVKLTDHETRKAVNTLTWFWQMDRRLPAILSHRRSTTVSLETYPLYKLFLNRHRNTICSKRKYLLFLSCSYTKTFNKQFRLPVIHCASWMRIFSREISVSYPVVTFSWGGGGVTSENEMDVICASGFSIIKYLYSWNTETHWRIIVSLHFTRTESYSSIFGSGGNPFTLMGGKCPLVLICKYKAPF